MCRRSSIGGRRRTTGLTAGWSHSDPAAAFGPTTAGTPWLHKKGGFTLLEILAVLALAGLISVLLLGSGEALLRAMAKDDTETVALDAVTNARHSAVLTGRQLELHYDEKARQLNWEEGQVVLAGEGDVRLLPPLRVSAMIVGGREIETPLARVRFYADGTCDPFRLEIVRDQTSRILAIDPWTCTVLSPEATPGHH